MRPSWLEPQTFAGRVFRSSSGQGIVEYILVLVVVIAVALAVSAAFFKPFNEWARNYIGDYIYCLLDEGELPSLGGEEAVTECEKNFESFSFGSGRPGKGGGGSGDEDEKGGRNRLGQNSANGGGGSGGGGGRRGRRPVSNIGEGFDSSNGARASKTTDVSSTLGRRAGSRTVEGGGRPSSVESRRRTEVYRGITGYLAQERDRIQKRESKIRSVGKSGDSTGYSARRGTKVSAYNPKSRKPSDLDLSSGDWSFGEWFRILLIIVIIIALVLFVGGQVLQISKSMEKE